MKHVLTTGWELARLYDVPQEQQLPDVAQLDFIPSSVPRSIQYDLVDAGLIPNFYDSTNNAQNVKWVSQTDWVYRLLFTLSEAELSSSRILLNFGCVDTYSDIFVNGTYIGSTNNMFLPWTFDLSQAKLSQENLLIVRVKGHRRMVAEKAERNVKKIGCYGDEDLSRERNLVRRYQRSYNTDLLGNNVSLQGIGILRDVWIQTDNEPVIDDVIFAVLAATADEADVEATAKVFGADEGNVEFSLINKASGETAYVFSAPIVNGKAIARTRLLTPALWWPRGEGEQNLYLLRAVIKECGKGSNVFEKQVGIRDIKVQERGKRKHRDFQFIVNGKPVYIRGGNWMPVDMLNASGTKEECERLFQLALNAHMNLLRLWGGGVEEEDWFYTRCDELGLMIWQDAHMHSHTYPDYDEEFVNQVCLESAIMVTHLRSHPCFAIFCGGNEQQEGWDTWNWQVQHDRFYGAILIYEKLPEIARKYCPEIPYITNSPYGEKNCQSPVDGDTHTWGNFFNATEDPLFVSETCWYSGTLCRPETFEELSDIRIDQYTGLRWHHEYHQRTGHKLYQVNQYSEYHEVANLREYLHGLEVEQLRADYHALYYLRSRSPSCTGILYWPLNKGGPMMNYGCIDYHGRPLMPYYGLVRTLADVVIHIYRDGTNLRITGSNVAKPLEGTLTIQHKHVNGQTLREEKHHIDLPKSQYIDLMTLKDWYSDVENRWQEYVYISVERDEEILAEDAVYFCPFAEVEMQEQALTGELKKIDETHYKLRIEADSFSKLIEIEANGRVMYSDNYFLMQPGTKEILITCLEPFSKDMELTLHAIDCDSVTTVRA